jgi:AraC-like DNA-binding protein
MALAAVGALAVLHGAQIVRMVFSEVEAVEDVVPLVGAAAFLALAGFVYFGGRVAALEPLTEASLAPTEEMQSLIGNLDKALLAGLLRDANLSQAQAAMAINATSQDVATALAAVHGVSFAEHIQRLRVQEARRLLADPREARTSMEAIGLLAGFGSRSAFYKAFRDVVGESPAAYRAGNPRNRVQMQENGQ